MGSRSHAAFAAVAAILVLFLVAARPTPPEKTPPSTPTPTGRLVDLGGHRLHFDCRGEGSPTVVVENGLGDFSFDWALVQSRVADFARVCTYDRGGHAWSDPGPKPRSFDQLNLELRDGLAKLGERGPFVLVGHSFGGPVVRQFALRYSADVAGVVLVDAPSENQRIRIPGRAIYLWEGAKRLPIPEPREELRAGDRPVATMSPAPPAADRDLDPRSRRLPIAAQRLRLWAQNLPAIRDAEDSEREWSTEYFARWRASSQEGSLGEIPLVVLTRRDGGYGEGLGVPAAELEAERRIAQAALARLSTRGEQRILECGHQMHLEVPEEVARAIRDVFRAAAGSRSAAPRIGCSGRRSHRANSRGSIAGR